MSIKIGWSEVDITPKKGQKIGLAGQFFERVTDEVESHITLTALTIVGDDDYVIMCSCDLVGVTDNLNLLVKESLKEYHKEINPDKVILSAIHSHTSYDYTQKDLVGTESSFDYLKTKTPEDMKYV